jgi:hypothetical protein
MFHYKTKCKKCNKELGEHTFKVNGCHVDVVKLLEDFKNKRDWVKTWHSDDEVDEWLSEIISKINKLQTFEPVIK